MSENGPIGTRSRYPSSQPPVVNISSSSGSPSSSSSSSSSLLPATGNLNVDLESQKHNSVPITPPRFAKQHSIDSYSRNVKKMDNDFESPSSPPKIQGTEKHLVVFGFDISHLSVALQFITLMSGLLIFMCLYGYFQELVIYGWFNRRLSIFSTFLHFFGCSIFALVQRRYFVNIPDSSSSSSKTISTAIDPSDEAGSSSNHHKSVSDSSNNNGINHNNRTSKDWYHHFFTVSMGSAPPHVAAGYYLLQIILKTLTQGFANLCMSQINYPAKVLFKSANPVVTMIIGLLWFRRSYALRDYIVVFLLVLGLYLFITTDKNAAPQSTWQGIFYVSLSMFFGASVPMIQEHCMTRYGATVEELLYYSFLGSTVFSFIFAGFVGELVPGLHFLYETGTLHMTLIFIVFTSVGFYGANFSTLLTQRFGSLVNGIANTTRKAITLGLSFALFPERNVLTLHHIIGAAVFLMGLLLRILFKENSLVFQHIGLSLSHFLLHRFGITLNISQYLSPYAGKPLVTHDHVSDDGLSEKDHMTSLHASARASPYRTGFVHHQANGSISSAPAYTSSSNQWSKHAVGSDTNQVGSALVDAESLPVHRRQQINSTITSI